MRLNAVQVKLDSGGYDRHGKYWGSFSTNQALQHNHWGHKLYRVSGYLEVYKNELKNHVTEWSTAAERVHVFDKSENDLYSITVDTHIRASSSKLAKEIAAKEQGIILSHERRKPASREAIDRAKQADNYALDEDALSGYASRGWSDDITGITGANRWLKLHKEFEDSAQNWDVAADAWEEAGNEKKSKSAKSRASKLRYYAEAYKRYAKEELEKNPSGSSRDKSNLRRMPKKSRAQKKLTSVSRKKGHMAGYRKSRRKKSRKKTRRDWRGNPKGHARAARKGWKVTAKPGWKPKRRKSRRKSRDMSSRDWKGHPRLHARATRLGWKRHAKKGWRPKHRRDPGLYGRDWPGHARGHSFAAKKGWKITAKRGWRPKRPTVAPRRDSDMRDWPGEPIRHAKASHTGWKRHAKKGWRPKHRSRYARRFKAMSLRSRRASRRRY